MRFATQCWDGEPARPLGIETLAHVVQGQPPLDRSNMSKLVFAAALLLALLAAWAGPAAAQSSCPLKQSDLNKLDYTAFKKACGKDC